MQLVGDPAGLAALQEMKNTQRDYLRFLIQEARTVFERRVDFKGSDGTAFRLTFVPTEGQLVVSRLP